MDEREREKFYSPPAAAADDEDYELEPLDPAIVSAEQRRAQEVAEQVRSSIDIDEVYREAERSRGTEILENWLRNYQYQFHSKHLLFATAALAIAIALAKLGYLGLTLTILIIGSLAGLYLYLNWHDRKQQAEAYQKRQELYARRRERFQAKETTPTTSEPIPSIERTPTTADSPPIPANNRLSDATSPEPMRISFSLRSLIIAMTVAAVSIGTIRVVGGPGPTATILGFIAVAGLIVHALGFEPPQSVILGWWFILMLYVFLSIAGAVWVGLA